MFKQIIFCFFLMFNFGLCSSQEIQSGLPDAWKGLFSKLDENQRLCISYGAEQSGVKLTSLDPTAKLAAPDDPRLKPVFETCDRFFAKKLRVNAPCNTKNSNGEVVKSLCSDQYVVEKDGRKLRTSLQNAIRYTFTGEPLSLTYIETEEARTERLAKEKDAQEQMKIAEAEKAAEEKKRQEYLNSPAYKKEQAAIAKQKAKEEDEARKAEEAVKKKQMAEDKKIAEAKAKEEQEAKKAEELAKKKQLEQEKQEAAKLAAEQATANKRTNQISSLVNSMGAAGWAQCVAGQVSMTAMIVRGDQGVQQLKEPTDKAGQILGEMRQYMLSKSVPQKSLDDLIRGQASQIRTGDQAFDVLNNCISSMVKAGFSF